MNADRLERYFTEWAPLPKFGIGHSLALLMIVVSSLAIPCFSAKRLNEHQQVQLGRALGLATFLGYFGWIVLVSFAGVFDVRIHLPLHLCFFLGLVAPLVMWRSFQAGFEMMYYCAFAGVVQACITPARCAAFPHLNFVFWWALHGGIILCTSYCIVVFKKVPTWNGIFTTSAACLALLVLAIPVNVILDANYLYTRAPSPGSIQEFLGPWPWYVVFSSLIGFLSFIVLWLAFLGIAFVVKRGLLIEPAAEVEWNCPGTVWGTDFNERHP